MSISTSEFPRLHQLCRRLEADIHTRGLREGDRYLTACQVGRLLGVSTTTAHRTLRLLADSRWVVRHRKRGTFVGPRAGREPIVPIRTVRVLLSADCFGMSSFSSDLLMSGIRSAIRGAGVQFDFVPEGDVSRYLGELLRAADADSTLLGFIAVSCVPEVYRRLAQAAVPTVVLGSLYLGDPPLPSIDPDHRQTGQLLAQHLVDGGHRRMAICSFSEARPGDNHFYEGVSDVLTAAQLPHNALRLLSIPRNTRSFEAAVRHLLELPDRPTALMTVGSGAADTAAGVAADLGLDVPGDVEIVFRGHTTTIVEQSRHVHVQPRKPFEEIAALAGGMLDRLSRGKTLERETVVIPVELRV